MGGPQALQADDEEDDIVDDPIITGERNGIAYGILQFIGALVSIPFVLYSFTLEQLDNLAKLAPTEEDDEDLDDDTKALPSETGGD